MTTSGFREAFASVISISIYELFSFPLTTVPANFCTTVFAQN